MFQDLRIIDFHAHFPVCGDVSAGGGGVRQYAAGSPAEQAAYMRAQSERYRAAWRLAWDFPQPEPESPPGLDGPTRRPTRWPSAGWPSWTAMASTASVSPPAAATTCLPAPSPATLGVLRLLDAALVRRAGLPFRRAHRVASTIVQLSEADSARVTVELVAEAARQSLGRELRLDQADLSAALDPWRCVEQRVVQGGPVPAAMESHLDQMRARLDAYAAWRAAREAQITSASGERARRAAALHG